MFSSSTTSKNKPNNSNILPPLVLLGRAVHLYKDRFWMFFGVCAWLLFPISSLYFLSFVPESPLKDVLDTVFNVIYFLLSFWIGIVLLLLIRAAIEKKIIVPQKLQRASLRFVRPSARVLLIQLPLIFFGLLLLIVPGVIAAVWFAFVQMAVVFDGKTRVKDAFAWSKSLSKNRFWPVLYRLLAGPIIIGVILSFSTSLIVLCIALVSGSDLTTLTHADAVPAWVNLTESVCELVATPLLTAYLVLLYQNLKETLTEPFPNSPIDETP